ncbi:MAG: hypothetical protein K0M50_05400 [Prolixibacteraceae bacterium]|nr:hypothetical protein [Prolixibacteraceae bacterium]
MSIYSRISLAYILAVALLFAGCERDENTSTAKPKDYPGFNLSQARPEGELFKWPDGISVLESRLIDDNDCEQERNDQDRNVGFGDGVMFCITFFNNTDKPITLTFPPGIIWVSTKGDVQNGIVPTRTSFEIPSNQPYYALMNATCINEPRGTTGGDWEKTPVITNHPGFKELFQILESKKLNYEEYGGDRYKTPNPVPVMRAIINISGGRPVTKEIWDEIKALPNK